MTIPDHVRDAITHELWNQADGLGWLTLNSAEKARHYENWTRDPAVGGQLARFMDSRQVRVYIKDTLLKPYSRTRLADPTRPFRVLGIDGGIQVQRYDIKPHGRLLGDGRVIAWGRADDWKSVLMAVHERAFKQPRARPFAAVLMYSAGRYHETAARAVAEDAARKLRIERLVWLD